MTVIGLTGGTGAGKGCVCSIFSKYGIDSIDTDKTSREVCCAGSPCLKELVSNFGNDILNPDRSLNRKKLAKIAFASESNHKTLNSITHKYILEQVRLWLDGQKKQNKLAAIVDAPLLFESGFDKECDVIISVQAPASVRVDRIIKRDGITLDEANARLNKQQRDSFYTDRSDYVITNSGELDGLEAQIKSICFSIFGKEL